MENGREKKIKYIGFFESGKMVIEVGKLVVISEMERVEGG